MVIKKRGVFFSIDALIALMIILAVVLIAYPLFKQSSYDSKIPEDILIVLSSVKVGEIYDSIPEGELKEEINAKADFEKTVLEQIAIFSVTNMELAEQFADEVLKDVEVQENLGLWFDNRNVWNNGEKEYSEDLKDIKVAKKLLSGVQNPDGNATIGYSARAFLSSKYRTNYYYFGGYVGDGNITARTQHSGEIHSVEMEITINRDFDLYVNNIFVGSYQKSPSVLEPKKYSIPVENFVSGENEISFRSDLPLAITGGFLKINYISDEVLGVSGERHYFPSVRGLINVYDSIYIPQDLQAMNIFLDLNSSFTESFLVLGDKVLFNSTTNGREQFSLQNNFLSQKLDYPSLTGKTIPLRLGMESTNQTSVNYINLVSVVDLSLSMNGDKIAQAKNSVKDISEQILSYVGNEVALAGYSFYASNFRSLSFTENKTEVNNFVDNNWVVDAPPLEDRTCICCGILRGINHFEPYYIREDFESYPLGLFNPKAHVWGITNIAQNNQTIISNSLNGSRSILLQKSSADYLANSSLEATVTPYIGKYFQHQENFVSLEFSLKIISASSNSKIQFSLLPGTDKYISENYLSVELYNGAFWSKKQGGDIYLRDYNLNEEYRVKIEADIQEDVYNVFINGIKYGGELSVYDSSFDLVRRVGLGTQASPGNFSIILDDIVLGFSQLPFDSYTGNSSDSRAIIILTDGQALAPTCGFRVNYARGLVLGNVFADQAIEGACIAKIEHNITVHTIALDVASNSIAAQTLQRMAQCGEGTYNLASSAFDLTQIYQQIAQTIIETAYQDQTLSVVEGGLTAELFSGSYVEFNYPVKQMPAGIVINTEQMLSQNFSLYNKNELWDLRIISYSGPRWTSKVSANGNDFFSLGNYGQDFTKVGDPYVVYVPTELINQGNNSLQVLLGSTPQDFVAGSAHNKILATLIREVSSSSGIKLVSEGCKWDIEFENGDLIQVNVPSNYVGDNSCNYQEGDYGQNDAYQVAVYNLLKRLDLNSNGKIDVVFNEQDLELALAGVSGIPFSYQIEAQVRSWR